MRILPILLILATVSANAQTRPLHWVGSWSTSQQLPERNETLPAADLTDATLRQVMHLSLGGPQLRIHVSNAFSSTALHITAVHIAHPASFATAPGQIDPTSDRALTFNGHAGVTIPPNAEFLSDPIAFPAPPLSDVAITLHLDTPPAQQTGHPGSRATSYIAHGDQLAAATLTGVHTFDHWEIISAIDVSAAPNAGAIVTLGDSITDGHGSTINANDRWPDAFAQRLQAGKTTRNLGVLNQGIGGNHLLTDGLGVNVLARFDRDVLAQTGVRSIILLEGVNDLGALARETNVSPERHAERVRDIEGAYLQIIARAHAAGLKVVAATILPYLGSDYYHPSATDEADRQQVNTWIRTHIGPSKSDAKSDANFDALADFDKITTDPANPGHLLPAYDCGDHLHPSPAGYRAMAAAVPLLY